MLIIERKARDYPPNGKLPSLHADADAFDAGAYELLATEYAEVALFEPILADAWPTLVDWTVDGKVRTYEYLTDAGRAALQEQRRHEALLSAERKDTTGRMDLDKFDKVEGIVLDVKKESAQERRFVNCGQTSAAIIERLAPSVEGLAKQVADSVPVFYGRDTREQLRNVLSEIPAPGRVLLLDFSFPTAHTFMLEIHSDGRRYLVQSYQGVYSLRWWLGLEGEAGLFLTKPSDSDEEAKRRYGIDLERLLEKRDNYGKGESIKEHAWQKFADNLVAAFETGDYQGFAKLWLDLPFAPTREQQGQVAVVTAASTVRFNRYEFADPRTNTQGCLSMTVIPAKQ